MATPPARRSPSEEYIEEMTRLGLAPDAAPDPNEPVLLRVEEFKLGSETPPPPAGETQDPPPSVNPVNPFTDFEGIETKAAPARPTPALPRDNWRAELAGRVAARIAGEEPDEEPGEPTPPPAAPPPEPPPVPGLAQFLADIAKGEATEQQPPEPARGDWRASLDDHVTVERLGEPHPLFCTALAGVYSGAEREIARVSTVIEN